MSGVHGIVLAGGRGTRLGLGVPKGCAMLWGTSLLARAVETLRSLCGSVSIVAPPDVAALIAGEALGCEIELDAPGGGATGRIGRREGTGREGAGRAAGPLAGLVAGLESAARRGAAHAVVLAVDLPFVRAEMLGALLEIGRSERALAVIPEPGGIPQPLAAIYAREAAPQIAAAFAAGVRSVTEAVGSLAPRFVRDAELGGLPGGIAAFANLNTPEDLAEAERRRLNESASGAPRDGAVGTAQ